MSHRRESRLINCGLATSQLIATSRLIENASVRHRCLPAINCDITKSIVLWRSSVLLTDASRHNSRTVGTRIDAQINCDVNVHSCFIMAASKDMQMSMQIKYDLCSLLENNKLSNIEGVRKDAEMKVTSFISKSKRWNPFQKGKNGRDLSSELLIPKHITESWQCGELRALK